jgi:hypothetical protein
MEDRVGIIPVLLRTGGEQIDLFERARRALDFPSQNRLSLAGRIAKLSESANCRV